MLADFSSRQSKEDLEYISHVGTSQEFVINVAMTG